MWFVLLACGAPGPAPGPAPVAPAAPPPPPPAPPAAAPAAPWDGRRIVAVGDLHGDLDNAVATLAMVGVVDGKGRWSGGDTVLVQTGDTTDRGDDSGRVMAFLRGLQLEAKAAGGEVVALLGNHEVMNLRGDLRYVSAGDTAAYGGAEARKAAFSAAGVDGAWLRTLPATARVGETVFAHGGIREAMAAGGVDAINPKVTAALDSAAEAAVLGPDGPLWYRGYVKDPESSACAELGRALGLLGARRMVVGHTTRDDGKVEARCGGRLLVVDIGISDHYGAHLGAVELRGGTDAWAVYGAMTVPASIPVGAPVDLPDPG